MSQDGRELTFFLLHQAREGDGSARAELLERLRPRIVLWIASRLSKPLRERVDPEDVAQEVLLAVHRDLGSLDSDEGPAFYNWLFRIAENRIRDVAAYHGAKKRQPVAKVVPTQTTPGTRAARAEQLALVRECIENLPDDYRTVVKLRRLEELPVKEVALRMDRSENAVRVLYCRALKALRDEMLARE
jgi:RNA polymerase sigma-70 factor (ECF subfamily)